MRATITNPLAVKAAANLANGGYPYSIFQVRREGASAKVCGMNGYTSIAVNPYFVKLASQAMDTLKTGKSCDFKPCGGSAALRMDMSAEEVSACALVAPFARRYA